METLQRYYMTDAISQSLLVSLAKGIGTFNAARENNVWKKKPHFDEGSLYECKLTYPELFDDLYCVIDDTLNNTTGMVVRNVFDMAMANHYELPDWENEVYDNYILSACEQMQFGGSWSAERKIATIRKNGTQYFEDLRQCGNKTDVTTAQLEKILDMVTRTLTSPHTNKIFPHDKSVIRLVQHPIYWKHPNGHSCKALLDMVDVWEDTRVIQPWDIKTIGDSVKAFPKSAIQRRYDVQAAWYTLALQAIFPMFTILPFKFLVCSTSTKEEPLVYTMTEKDMQIAMHGGIWRYDGKRKLQVCSAEEEPDIPGINHMIMLYEAHLLANQWEKDMVIYENNGNLPSNFWI